VLMYKERDEKMYNLSPERIHLILERHKFVMWQLVDLHLDCVNLNYKFCYSFVSKGITEMD
jgi:hypothetical protein